jgi:hypothetical protein
VLAFIGTDGTIHVLVLQGQAWTALGSVPLQPGDLPLSISMASDAAGRVVLAWAEASHVLPWGSGQRVQPNHAASRSLGWAQLQGGAFTSLPSPALDADRGTFEHPFVTFDAQGRAAIAFVEDGRVVVRARSF